MEYICLYTIGFAATIYIFRCGYEAVKFFNRRKKEKAIATAFVDLVIKDMEIQKKGVKKNAKTNSKKKR